MKNTADEITIEVQAYKAIAQSLIDGGASDQVEFVLNQALAITEKNEGPQSILTAMVLFELLDLYDLQNRKLEAMSTWSRISEIVLSAFASSSLREAQSQLS